MKNQLKELLTPPALEKCTVIPLKPTVNQAFKMVKAIKSLKFLTQHEGNKEIVRVILYKNSIVTVQTKDNGTPYAFVFEKEFDDEKFLDYSLKSLCKSPSLKLIYSKID